MKYWDEFIDKSGFNKGEDIPPEAEACRYIYVTAMNTLLKKHGSDIRVAAWDADNCPNCYRILRVRAALIADDQFDSWNDHLYGLAKIDFETQDVFMDVLPHGNEPVIDNAWQAACDEAFEMCLDQYVNIEVTIIPTFVAELRGIGRPLIGSGPPTQEGPSQ